MSAKGRKSIKQRRLERAKRQAAAAPPPPKAIDSQVVEIKGPAKAAYDPDFDEGGTDHQGALGELEATYYNPERKEHMGRVRVGAKPDGTGGQLRGVPLHRLEGVKSEAPTKAAGAPTEALHFGPTGVSSERWEQIFGKTKATNLMDEDKAAAAREELRRLSAQINGA